MKNLIVNIIFTKEFNFLGMIAYIYFYRIIFCFILKVFIFVKKKHLKKRVLIFQIKFINKDKGDFSKSYPSKDFWFRLENLKYS